MVKTTLIDNTNVSNVVIPPISNETVPFTNAKPVDKLHPDMHQKPVKDVFSTTESADIMRSRDTTITTSLKSVDVHVMFTFLTI
jgi:hypothetical protein